MSHQRYVMKVVHIKQLSDLNHSAIKEYQKEHPSDPQGEILPLSVALTQMLHWEGVINYTGRIMEIVQAAFDQPKKKLYQEIASTVGAFHRCVHGNNNEWEKKHEEHILKLVYDHMPSGSGWDCATKIDLDSSSEDRLVFYGSFHHMNEVGYYDGWTDHRIFVTPSFNGFDLRITGPNRNDIKEYLHQLFDAALEQEV